MEATSSTSKDPKAKYYTYFRENTVYLDAFAFSGIKPTLLAYLDDPECPDQVKVMVGEWLFRKIYMFHKIRDLGEKEAIASKLVEPIRNIHNLVTKAQYLQYRDMIATGMVALRFYMEPFVERDKYFILQLLNDTELIKGYLQRTDLDDERLLVHFLDWVAASNSLEQRSNILDVLLRYYPRDDRVKSLYDQMRFGGSKTRNVYTDAQNVHDEEINAESLRAAANLIRMTYPDWFDREGKLIPGSRMDDSPPLCRASSYLYQHFPDPRHQPILQCVLERLKIDTTSFSYTFSDETRPTSFTMFEVMCALIDFIKHSPCEVDLLEALIEEMDSMKELCASGYVARFVNVLQNSPNLPKKLVVTISSEKRIYAILSYKLSKSLEKAGDDVGLGAIDDAYRPHFLFFVKKIANEALGDIIAGAVGEELITIKKDMCAVLANLTGGRKDERWMFVEEKICVVRDVD